MFVWGCPCLRTGVDLAIGLTAKSGIPLPWLRSRRCTRFIFAGPLPRQGSLEKVMNVPRAPFGKPALSGRSISGGDVATNRPDEARELTRDRGDGDSLQLAPPDQRSIAPVQAALRLPRDLANRPPRGGDLLLLLLSHPRWMLTTLPAFAHKATPPPPPAPSAP